MSIWAKVSSQTKTGYLLPMVTHGPFGDADDGHGEADPSSQLGNGASSLRSFLGKAEACNPVKDDENSGKGKRGRSPAMEATSKASARVEYSMARKAFLDEAQKKGSSFKKANAAWLSCPSRAALLAAMPLAELKRRRFIPKEANQNLFAVAALGG